MLSKTNRVVASTTVPGESVADFPGFLLRRVSEPTIEGSSQLMRLNHDTIAPGGGCDRHLHNHTEETWLILSGTGHWYCDGEISAIKPGDVCYAEPGAVHQIINSGKDDLVFYTVTCPPCDMEHDIVIKEAFDFDTHVPAG
ncbi:MAG: cupin domain-containing protein [Flavobacteriaceae bacterium]